MNIRALSILLLVFVPLTVHAAAKKKQPLTIEVSPSSGGLPLVTATASDAPLGEIAERLEKKLGTKIDVSAAARDLRVTTALDRQPLDLMLRELAPQVYLDGILSGGAGKTTLLTIHLRTAGESAPTLAELRKSSSEVFMISGHTEDPAIDPSEGQLDVTYRNGRLRVFGKKQPLSVVVATIAEKLGIPLEMIGDSLEVIDVAVADATVEQVMSALTPSVKLYYRKDLATFGMTPVRLVLEAPLSTTPTP